jgi:hypothetical protein
MRGESPPVPIGYEVVWAPELVWTLCRREKSLALTEIRTPAVQPVTSSNGSMYLLIKNLSVSSECCFVVCFEVATQ